LFYFSLFRNKINIWSLREQTCHCAEILHLDSKNKKEIKEKKKKGKKKRKKLMPEVGFELLTSPSPIEVLTTVPVANL